MSPASRQRPAGRGGHRSAHYTALTLIFDVALWHRNPLSAERTQWSITYTADPRDADEFSATVKFIGDFFGKHPGYDTLRFPYFPADWLDGSSESVRGRNLNKSGVMRSFVERFGEFL